MCRYSFHTYKSHFACFGCRNTFKKPVLEEWFEAKGMASEYWKLNGPQRFYYGPRLTEATGLTSGGLRDQYLSEAGTCPQCARSMAHVGLDFRAPKQSDVSTWEILEKLHEKDFSFFGCECGSGYTAPSKSRDLPEFFASLSHSRPLSKGQRLLAEIDAKRVRS